MEWGTYKSWFNQLKAGRLISVLFIIIIIVIVILFIWGGGISWLK